MKTTTAFEVSGNSPTQGHGVESVRRRIMEAFERVHGGMPAPVKTEKQPNVYSEAQEQRFHTRAKNLIAAALPSSHLSKATHDADWIVVPSESAEELIAEALRRFD